MEGGGRAALGFQPLVTGVSVGQVAFATQNTSGDVLIPWLGLGIREWPGLEGIAQMRDEIYSGGMRPDRCSSSRAIDIPIDNGGYGQR